MRGGSEDAEGRIDNPASGRNGKTSRPRGRPALDVEYQRNRILAAATKVFIERGFSAGSVHAVGHEAGVTKRTIYELVGDKDALFHAVCERLATSARIFHFDAAVTTMPVRDILLDMATTILDAALAPKSIAFNRMLAVEARRFPQLIVSVMDGARHAIHATMAGVFAELAVRKRIRPVDPSDAANTFYDTIVGSRAMRAMLGYNEPHPPAHEIEARVDMILRGYLDA